MQLISKYITKNALKNLLATAAIFVLLFTLIDVFTRVRAGNMVDQLILSLLYSIINFDVLFCFICLIGCIITLVKFKQTAQDIALISLDNSPVYVFNCISYLYLAMYMVYIVVIHPISFEVVKRIESKVQNINCIRETVARQEDKSIINIGKIKYNICKDGEVINEVDASFDINSKILNVDVYDSNKKGFIRHSVKKNQIDKVSKETKTNREIKAISKIDEYLEDVKTNQISLYHIVTSFFKDKRGVLSAVDVLDIVFGKVKNALLVLVCVNICYFIFVSHKRSMKTVRVIVSIIIFVNMYYILSYLVVEKVKYADSLIIKFMGFCLLHISFLLWLKYIQHKCILNFSEGIKNMKHLLRV